eukprot:1002941-Pelagomonas_calceolata.AAC.4
MGIGRLTSSNSCLIMVMRVVRVLFQSARPIIYLSPQEQKSRIKFGLRMAFVGIEQCNKMLSVSFPGSRRMLGKTVEHILLNVS